MRLWCCLFALLSVQISFQSHAAIILQYHHVSTQTPRSTSVTPEEFRTHLQYLKDHQYQVIGLDTLLDQLQQGKELGDVMDTMFEQNNIKQKGGAIGLLTQNKLSRSSVYHQALILAMIPFLNPDLF